MKTRRLLIIVLVVALLVGYYILGTDYLKQGREHEALVSQISEATQVLTQIPPPPADLEQRLAAARTALESANNTLPNQLNSTRIINAILRLADEVGVRAIPLTTQPWTTETVSGEDYSVFRLHIVVTGPFTQLSSFISRLENGELETLVMEYLTVDSFTGPFRGEGVYADTLPVDAGLEIAVYARPQPTDIEDEGTL